MTKEWLDKQRKRADEHLASFLDDHAEYSVDREVLWLKGTHLVTFGAYGGKPVVYKYYDGDPRKEHEKRSLELFWPTGLVPRVYAETDVMLVMERLPGLPVNEIRDGMTVDQWDELNFQLGVAVSQVVKAAPGAGQHFRGDTSFRACSMNDFYETPYEALIELYREADAIVFFDTTVNRAWKVLQDREMPHKDVLQRSLRALKENRNAILSFPEFVHMDDFHDNNIMAHGSQISGFIDLEMTRFGNEILMLGAAMYSMRHQSARWASFRSGYEKASGGPLDKRILSLVRTAAPFGDWIRFTWHCSTDALPWWAREEDHRLPTIEALKDCIETIETMEH